MQDNTQNMNQKEKRKYLLNNSEILPLYQRRKNNQQTK